MTVDRHARTTLQKAIVGYMCGAIRTFEFEDQCWPCYTSPDEAVQGIAREVWYIHDQFINHPISVTEHGWEALRRAVAFLSTDLEITAKQGIQSSRGRSRCPNEWPFEDEAAWRANQHLLNQIDLPEYDPAVHGRPAHPWWNRIPSRIGFLVLAVVAVVFAAILIVFGLS